MSVQLTYGRDFVIAFSGLLADIRDNTIITGIAQGVVQFGYGVVSGSDVENQVRVPALNVTILSIDADLIASNSTIATVNGDSTTATVFATSHAATLAAIAVKIALLPDVDTAVVGPGARDITITGLDGIAVSASAVTTLGVSQGTWTQAQSSGDVFRGISVHQHVEQSTAGVQDAAYRNMDTVGVLSQGALWTMVEPSATMAIDDVVYINMAVAGQEGKITNVSTGNIATGGKVRKVTTDPAGLDIAMIEINLP